MLFDKIIDDQINFVEVFRSCAVETAHRRYIFQKNSSNALNIANIERKNYQSSVCLIRNNKSLNICTFRDGSSKLSCEIYSDRGNKRELEIGESINENQNY